MPGLCERDLKNILIDMECDAMFFDRAHFFITGGTGYIGKWLLESICYFNDQVGWGITATVLSRNPSKFMHDYPHLGERKFISLIRGDVRDFQYPDGEFTHVIHAATDVVAESSYLDTFDVTVNGTHRVLDFCESRGVKRVLLLSSGAVYGKIPYSVEFVPETYHGELDQKDSKTAYGLGKFVTEWLGGVYSESGEMACVFARLFAQIGPFLALDKQFAAGNFLLNAIRRDPFLIKGDGMTVRSYMYGTDLVVWLLRLLNHGESKQAYNVGSDSFITILDLAKKIAQVAGIKEPVMKIVGASEPRGAIDRYVPDISLARQKLGLKINVELEDAIARTLEWFQPIYSKH